MEIIRNSPKIEYIVTNNKSGITDILFNLPTRQYELVSTSWNQDEIEYAFEFDNEWHTCIIKHNELNIDTRKYIEAELYDKDQYHAYFMPLTMFDNYNKLMEFKHNKQNENRNTK